MCCVSWSQEQKGKGKQKEKQNNQAVETILTFQLIFTMPF